MTAVRASLTTDFRGTTRRSTRRLPVAVGLSAAALLSAALWVVAIVALLRIF